jgi:catechol 2,3-dioxygenase-like lactoylglutathione lyase family enzyme
MKITRMNHAAVNVLGKVEEAHAFYTEVLGLPQVPIQVPGMPPVQESDIGFWVEQEGVQLHVIGREPMGGTPDPTQAHVSWYVQDLDEATQTLAGQGLEMRVMGEGQHRIIWVLDPAGNIVELQQDPQCLADNA